MTRSRSAPFLIFVLLALGAALPAAAEPPLIQMAILLDTSSSMNGLIDQARSQLWTVVGELGRAERYGERPIVEVALYEYGNSKLAKETGFVRQVLPFTTDLDLVSENLFALTTSGGSEHCGQVISEAVRGLAWSDSYGVLKLVFIAGNEAFTQGPVPYEQACDAAVDLDVVVNTIYCGTRERGIEDRWSDGARLANGTYASIDQGLRAASVSTPLDDEITRLGVALNSTYIPYGADGADGLRRQKVQDSNAERSNRGTAVTRSMVKASPQYVSPGWDLVDAVRTGRVHIDELHGQDLPEVMRAMTMDERQAYVEDMMRQRIEIQNRIRALSQQRGAYLAERRPTSGGAEQQQSLDGAIIDAVRTQGQRADLEFDSDG